MSSRNFKKQYLSEELGINKDFGKIFSFIDFSNVNKWFDDDTQDWDNRPVSGKNKLSIDLKKLKSFADIFSKRARIYYGEDPKNPKSIAFTYVIRKIFGKKDVITKDIQKIKHYLEPEEKDNIKNVIADDDGKDYVEIRKCNFDVEISVDAFKMLEHYDTFCIFSGDVDFVYLNNFLKKKGKKIILIKAGYITSKLRKSANIVINAQNIKKHIAQIKPK